MCPSLSMLSIVAAVLVLAAAPSSAFVPSPHPSASSCVKRPLVHWYRVREGGGDGAGEWGDDEGLWTVDERAIPDDVAIASMLEVFPNPLAELDCMHSNFDDVFDDFLNNRMGDGEVLHGKRRCKPSGRISSDDDGGGPSDWSEIEAAREFREERAKVREESIMEEARRQMEGLSP